MDRYWAIAGHRGARGEAPENTLPGFRHAIALGLESVELDVQLSADGVPVVIHDDTVDRTTDGHGLVRSMTLFELQQLDARADFSDWPEPCQIPTLAEVFAVLGDVVDITVEIKSDPGTDLERLVPRVIETIVEHDRLSNVTITSFDPAALAIAQHFLPHGRRGLTGLWNHPDELIRALELGCCRADVSVHAANSDVAAAASAAGLRVMVWTVNTPEELARALTLAPDLICTDVPTSLASLCPSAP